MTTKNDRCEFRLSKDDHQQIIAKAKNLGISKSEFILACTLRRQLPPSKLDQEVLAQLILLMGEIKRVGNNLNQIAKTCNTSQQLGEPVVVNTAVLSETKQALNVAIATTENAILKLTK